MERPLHRLPPMSKRLGQWVRMAMAFSLVTGLVSSCGKPDSPRSPEFGAPANLPGRIVTLTIPNGAVSLGDRAFGNGPLPIELGDTVHWLNQDSVPHTVTSTSGVFDSGPILPGKSFDYRFWKSGEYPYFCGMQGLRGAVKVTGVDAGARPPHTPHPEPGEGEPGPQPAPSSQPPPPTSACHWTPPSWWPWPC
jgi:hypothetical protein